MNFLRKKMVLITAVIMPMIMICVLYIHAGIAPFGSHSISNFDMNNQYLALITYLRQNITHVGNLFYTRQVGLGQNFFPVWTYYLASPVNILAVFFKPQNIIYFYELNTFLIASVSSLSMFLFLTRSDFLKNQLMSESKLNDQRFSWIACTFAIAYAMSAFFFSYRDCVFWFNAIALFPIVLLGFDRVVYRKNGILYLVSLAYILITNYYIGFMILLFLIMLTVFCLGYKIAVDKLEGKSLLALIMRIFLLSLSATLMGMVSILPSWIAQRNVTQSTFEWTFDQQYPFIKFLSAFFMFHSGQGTANSIAPELYTLVLVPILICFYFLNKCFKKSVRTFTGFFLIVLTLTAWLTTPFMIWHGLTMPNSYLNREAFVLIFVILVIAFQALCKLNELSVERFLTGVVVTFFVFILVILFDTDFAHQNLILNLCAVLLWLAVLFGYYHFRLGKYGAAVILALAVLEVLFTNHVFVSYEARNSASQSGFSRVVKETREVTATLNQKNNSVFRVGSTFEMNPNDPLMFNYAGVSGYLSQIPTKQTDYLSNVGYFHKYNWKRWSRFNNGSTLSMDSLLGIKYVLASDDKKFIQSIEETNNVLSAVNTSVAKDYSTAKFQRFAVIKAYQNKQAFPLIIQGAAKKENIGRNSVVYNPFAYQNKIWSAISGINTLMYSNPQVTKIVNSDTSMTYRIAVRKSGQLYFSIPVPQNTLALPKLTVEMNGNKIVDLFSPEEAENGVVSLGKVKAGRNVTISVSGNFKAKSTFDFKPLFAIENERLLTRVRRQAIISGEVETPRTNASVMMVNTNHHFKAHRLIATVPFDSGWHAVVDGKKTKVSEALGQFPSVQVPSGRHTVRFQYEVPGLKLALALGFLGLLMGLLTLSRLKK